MNGLYRVPGLFLTSLCHVIVVYYMSEHRYSRKKYMLFSLIYIVGFISISAYGFTTTGMSGIFSYMGIVVELFLYSCLVSKDAFPKKSFLVITYFCLFSVLDNMVKLIVRLFLPKISVVAGYYVPIVLRIIMILLLLFLYKKYAVAEFRSLTDRGRSWWNLVLIALLFYLLQAALTILGERNAMSDAYLLFVFAAGCFVMCIVYSVVFSNIRYMKKDAEAALIRQNTKYLFGRLSVMQEAEEAHRRLRHDMRHNLETIVEYAKAGDTSAILTFAREYGVEISETSVKQYSLNQTINSILSVYADKVEESDVSFSVRCKVPKELKVREIDVVALLGNLLENALHGCRESGKENPSMEIHIRLQNDRLIIVCNNTCSDYLKLSGSLPEGKSTGISSILSVCRKYDGNLDYRIEKGVCSACAVLNL